jgi:tetratricopeptide (TPR) repeat protein
MSRRWTLILPAVAAFCVYANSLPGTFHYDDHHSIVRNPHIRDLANLPRFFVDPSTFSGDTDKGMYRPVLLTSLAANHAVHGYDPAGYHAVNLALHGLAAALLCGLVMRLSASTAVGLAAGLVFAVHPLTAEPVNYVSSRSELLLGVFVLACLWAHVAGRRGLALVACGLALLSKATAVMLLPLLIVVDRWVLRRGPDGLRGSASRYAGYFGLTVAYLVAIVVNGYLTRSVAAPVRDLPTQWLTQLKAPAYYLRLLAVPQPLSVEPAFTESATFSGVVVVGLLFVLSAAWLLWQGCARRVAAGSAGLVVGAGLLLLPTSGMPLNMLVNERRLYLVAALLTVALVGLVRRRTPALLAVVVLSLLTVQRNEAWASPVRLWEAARTAGSSSYRMWVNLGKAYQEEGRTDEAEAAYRRALELDDRYADAWNNLAVVAHAQGRVADAISLYEEALRRDDSMEEIHLNLADAYLALGQPDEAERVYERALALDPANGRAWNNLGELRMALRRPQAALVAFDRAADLLPDRFEPHNNRGNALDGLGRRAEAAEAYRRALDLGQGEAGRGAVHANLGETLRRLGDARAAAHLDSAVLQQPTPAVFDYRARLAWDEGRMDDAAADWRRSVDLDPQRASAWTGLGEVALRRGDAVTAAAAFARALSEGESLRARWGLALARDRSGHVAAARDAYAAYLDAAPKSDGRRMQALDRLAQLGGRP